MRKYIGTVCFAFICILFLSGSAYATYDYTTGRWLQRDPIGYADGMNLYEYVKNKPIIYLDPQGFSGFMPKQSILIHGGYAVFKPFPVVYCTPIADPHDVSPPSVKPYVPPCKIEFTAKGFWLKIKEIVGRIAGMPFGWGPSCNVEAPFTDELWPDPSPTLGHPLWGIVEEGMQCSCIWERKRKYRKKCEVCDPKEKKLVWKIVERGFLTLGSTSTYGTIIIWDGQPRCLSCPNPNPPRPPEFHRRPRY